MKIKILVTGGTFDKEYNELTGELIFKQTHVSEMLKLGRVRLDISVEKVMMIDSLKMDEQDRLKIVENCINASEEQIIITHGTDTMEITARLLGQKIDHLVNKTIVLTGAMVPYKFSSSDGLFNLSSAIAFVQVLSPGIYVAMNGQYFEWDNVTKNKEKGIFEAIDQKKH